MLTVKRLDLADARILIEGAAEKAREIGVPMCIAITDESGNLIAFERMDGGKITSVTIAQDKSFTARQRKRLLTTITRSTYLESWHSASTPKWVAVSVLLVVACR